MEDILQLFHPNHHIPQLSIDYVIFTYHEQSLKVLALRPKMTNYWVLPSGFIKQDEDLEDAAKRNLKDRTGIENLYLRQFHAFGKTTRVSTQDREVISKGHGIPEILWNWINKRFVTIGYFALVEFSKVSPELDMFSEDFTWLDIDNSSILAMDHSEIVQKAREVLSVDMLNFQLAANLLPEMFTLPELQKLFEAMLGRKIDRGNFRKRILKENVLEKLDIQKTGGPHRSPYLYRFIQKDQQSGIQDSVKLGF